MNGSLAEPWIGQNFKFMKVVEENIKELEQEIKDIEDNIKQLRYRES